MQRTADGCFVFVRIRAWECVSSCVISLLPLETLSNRGERSRGGSQSKTKISFFTAIARHVSSLIQIISYCFWGDEVDDLEVVIGFTRVYRRLCAFDTFLSRRLIRFVRVSFPRDKLILTKKKTNKVARRFLPVSSTFYLPICFLLFISVFPSNSIDDMSISKRITRIIRSGRCTCITVQYRIINRLVRQFNESVYAPIALIVLDCSTVNCRRSNQNYHPWDFKFLLNLGKLFFCFLYINQKLILSVNAERK